MPKTREDFAPDIGGFLDDVPGDIVEAGFEIASGKYADQVALGGSNAKLPVVLSLTIESPDLDSPATQNFSVGSQDIWEISDDGKSIKNKKNADKHAFRKGSIAWNLVEAMMNSVGDGDFDKGQDFFVKRDKFMTTADFYTGLSFHWTVQEITMEIGNKTTGIRTVTSRPPLPEKFLGETKGSTSSTATSTVKSEVLDKILIDNASGKDEKQLKSFAVRNPEIKKNDVYMKSIVSGKRLKELEANGDLTKDPDTGAYL